MKRKVGLLTGLVVVVVLLVGCTTFKANGLSFMPVDNDLQVVGTFKDSVMVHKFLGTSGGTNLFNISSGATVDKLSAAVWKHIQSMGGTGATNVSITYGSNILHWFLNGLTWGIWAPAKITISGTVVRDNNTSMSHGEIQQMVQNALTIQNAIESAKGE